MEGSDERLQRKVEKYIMTLIFLRSAAVLLSTPLLNSSSFHILIEFIAAECEPARASASNSLRLVSVLNFVTFFFKTVN